jgi:hypothetical protein
MHRTRRVAGVVLVVALLAALALAASAGAEEQQGGCRFSSPRAAIPA